MKETYRHNVTKKLYESIGTLLHKDQETREWIEHIMYKDLNVEGLYSRTIEDFNNNFTKAG